MCHYTEDQCKLWKKNDLLVHKWHEEFDELHRSTQKFENLKICTFMVSFCDKISAKKGTEELSLMTQIFEYKLTFYLKNDMRNLANFSASRVKSGNVRF